MQDEDLKKILKKQWTILPEDVRTLVLSTEFESKINWIGGKYNLSPEQTEALKQETLFVLIGLAHIMDYTDNIMRELAISKEQARVIAQEVGTQIFAEVKESVKELGWVIEMQREQRGGSGQIPTQTPAPTPTLAASNIQPSGPTIIKTKEDVVPNVPVAGVLIEQEDKEQTDELIAEHKINKAVLLDEIEHPALIAEHAGTIVDQKLSGIVKIPREEVKVSVQNQTPQKKYDGLDPYREPIQ